MSSTAKPVSHGPNISRIRQHDCDRQHRLTVLYGHPKVVESPAAWRYWPQHLGRCSPSRLFLEIDTGLAFIRMTAAGRKAMSKMKLRVCSDEQKEHVAIQLVNLDTGKALGAILLGGASAEHHIHEVAKSRAILKGGVSPSIDPGFRFDAVLEPSWQ